MDGSGNDFLIQYKAISAKLKKRFLRKPNIAEASAQFGMLAKELENQECPHYSAFCCLAVARCEHTVGNSVHESQNLLHAARLFLENEKLNHELLCPTYSEYLQAALSAYRDCIKVYLNSDQPALAAALYLEVGQALRNLGRVNEAIPYFFKAAELHKPCALGYIHDMKQISDARIRTEKPFSPIDLPLASPIKGGPGMGVMSALNIRFWKFYLSTYTKGDFDGALTVLTEMQVVAEKQGFKDNGERIGAFSSILNEVEVTRILLLLLLQPPKYKLNPEHSKLLDRYADMDTDPVDYIEEDLYLLLQSLKIAVEERNESALLYLERDLWTKLKPLQNDILNKILSTYRDYSLVIPHK